MKDIVQVLTEWEELLRDSREMLFFDKDRFKACMQDAYECFKDRLGKNSYSREEMSLYGLLTAYSAVNTRLAFEKAKVYEKSFEKYIVRSASTNAVADFAIGIINPERIKIKNNIMTSRSQYVDGTSKDLTYDFETGDLCDYTKEVKEGMPLAFYCIDEE